MPLVCLHIHIHIRVYSKLPQPVRLAKYEISCITLVCLHTQQNTTAGEVRCVECDLYM